MPKLLIAFLITLSFSSTAFADNTKIDDETRAVMQLMVTAKATGMCGVFNQMLNFQKATKMSGGDEFIVRFLNTEASRLGFQSSDDFLSQCPAIINKYDSTMKELDPNY